MKLLALILFLVSLPVYAMVDAVCEKGTIRYFVETSYRNENTQICFTKEPRYKQIVSSSCVAKDCLALNPLKENVVLDKYEQQGNPAFVLCRKVGGVPQLIEYKKVGDQGWHSSSRCIFEDNSFVHTDLLYAVHKEHIKYKD